MRIACSYTDIVTFSTSHMVIYVDNQAFFYHFQEKTVIIKLLTSNFVKFSPLINYWHANVVCLSDGLSVRPSVTLCIVAKRYILQQKCLNK